MKKSILAVAVAAILISCGPKPAAVSLFNGKDLNGWTAVARGFYAPSLDGIHRRGRSDLALGKVRLHPNRNTVRRLSAQCRMALARFGDQQRHLPAHPARRHLAELLRMPVMERQSRRPDPLLGHGKRRVAGRLDADHTPETRALDGETGRRMEHGRDRLLGQHDHRARQRPASEPAHRSVEPSGIHRPAKRRRPRPVPQHHPHSARLRGSRTLPPGVGITLGK